MYNTKPHRPNSKRNADNQKAAIDPTHYPYMAFPKEAPVQPGDRVEYTVQNGDHYTGDVLPEGAYLLNNRIYVRVSTEGFIDAVAADTLTKVFDYDMLDSETRIVVQQKTGEIKTLMRRAAQDIIDIGAKLVDVKAKLEHGQFGKWLDAEFAWDVRQAQRMMNVCSAFKNDNLSDLKFGASALYLLAAPSTPEEARQEAITLAQSGQAISFSTAKAIIAEHKPPVSPAPQPAPTWQDEANRAFAPVTRPPAVTYGKVEDTFRDDVPSVDVDDEDDLSGDEWINKALAGELPAQGAPFQIGDEVSTKFGRTGGVVIDLDPLMGSQVRFGTSIPYWMANNVLVLTKRGNGTEPADVITQAKADVAQMPSSPMKDRLAAIVDQQAKDHKDRAIRLANWQEHERLRTLAAQTPPPEGQYRTLVIDPPWPMKKIERGVRPNQGEFLDYPTMKLPEIYDLKIPELAANDGCHLYLWTTHKFLPEALKLTARWGFRYNCLLTWEKNSGMTPYHFRFNTELVIFATRGSMAVQQKGLPLCFRGESSSHSRKPDRFYEMVTAASPGPRLDMFARCTREGFVAWGNEVSHAAAAD